jgi:orotidine-5'-phosphate decarboxylase
VLYVREGPGLVREFVSQGLKVFLDLKWHDIPSTVAEAVRAARDLGVSMATVHCLGGAAMLDAARAAAGDLALVGVTVLTSHDSASFGQVVGRGVPDLGVEAERLARLAVRAGLRGVVASGHELAMVRGVVGAGSWIVVPGIRFADDGAGGAGGVAGAPGAGRDDQVRTMTPREAQRLGATHLVVGRPITQAEDPVAAYRRMLESL